MSGLSFVWRGLLVSCSICKGTTPPNGPDPDLIEDFTFYMPDGTPLPEDTQEWLAQAAEDELVEKACEYL